MDILTQARSDWDRFTSNGGFQVEIAITTPSGDVYTVFGLAVKHHLSIDPDGLPVSSKVAHITITEQVLLTAGYNVRDSKQEVNLINNKVSYKDNSGVLKHYIVSEQYADETVGAITLNLNDYE